MVEVIQFLGNKAAALVAKYPLGSFGRSKKSSDLINVAFFCQQRMALQKNQSEKR